MIYGFPVCHSHVRGQIFLRVLRFYDCWVAVVLRYGCTKIVKKDTNIYLSYSLSPRSPKTFSTRSMLWLQCKMEQFETTEKEINFVWLFLCVRLRFVATVISFMNFDQTWTAESFFYAESSRRENKKKIWRQCNDCFALLITAKWTKGQMNVCHITVNFYLISSFVWRQHVLPSLTKKWQISCLLCSEPITNTSTLVAHVPFVNAPRWILKTFSALCELPNVMFWWSQIRFVVANWPFCVHCAWPN